MGVDTIRAKDKARGGRRVSLRLFIVPQGFGHQPRGSSQAQAECNCASFCLGAL
jgi:hypothetical protein